MRSSHDGFTTIRMQGRRHQCRRHRVDQLLRVQNFCVARRLRRPVSTRASIGRSATRTRASCSRGRVPASWPNRTDPRGTPRPRRLLHARLRPQHRRRNHGPQQVRPGAAWDNHDWRGWWGDEPPFHTPVFVLTHHERPSFTLSDTTFHFVDGPPAAVSDRARDAARARTSGSAAGRPPSGSSSTPISSTPCTWRSRRWSSDQGTLWTSPDELLDRFHLEVVPSPSGVTHHLFWRR